MSRVRQDITATQGVGRASRQGNTRTAGLEQYFTPEATARELTHLLLSHLPSQEDFHWLEPAGGTGSFLKALLAEGIPEDHLTSYDIQPRHPLVQEADFLSPALTLPPERPLVALSNPPFGRNSSLAVPFFNKCATGGASYIAFVVPKSWRKWTLHNRLSPQAHLLLDEELTIDYEDAIGTPLPGGRGGLATVFQLWQVDGARPLREKVVVEERGYLRKVTPREADVALVVFGYSCGKLLEDFPREKAVTTTLYLQVANNAVRDALKCLPYSRYSQNVATTPALSLTEVKALLNEHFDKLAVEE